MCPLFTSYAISQRPFLPFGKCWTDLGLVGQRNHEKLSPRMMVGFVRYVLKENSNVFSFQVDLELNGEPLNIHMKLGETGEAFFVEEVPENEVEYSAHLATSPIPDNGFTLYQEQSLPPRRNSADFSLDKYQNQVSDYTQRRFENLLTIVYQVSKNLI